jgi:hypothetical protein
VFRAQTGRKAPAVSTVPERNYTEEAAKFDRVLDEKIASIRARQDSGEISTREAADLRVAALSHHLAAVTALRAQYFGDEDDTA